ncbi:DUF4114 domain-containing protein [Congregibacter brevis]|uniref:DUF4114 domain-containing protein n=1 Tax=Congregibacter brevis TaxID=3081201 RepID=A0ABZ0IH56_9GAMM|nr:DUF4114 domain-containing protein [Congregibacter sp. IMCC45268]
MRLGFIGRVVALVSWSAVCMLAAGTASASIIHFQPDGSPTFVDSQNGGPAGSIDGILKRTGLNNPSYENTAITFLTPGTSADQWLLTFTFIADTGSLNGAFGYFATSEVSDRTVGTPGWRNKAVSTAENSVDPNKGAVIFDDRIQRPIDETQSTGATDPTDPNTAGSIRQLTVNGGLELGFVLWTNRVTPGEQLFSDQRANRDGDDAGILGDDMLLSFSGTSTDPTDSLLSGFAGKDITLFAFEDVIFKDGNGDNDYTDLVFTVTPDLITGQVLPPENVPAPPPAYLLGAGLVALCSRRRRI